MAQSPQHDCPGVADVVVDDFILAFGAFADGGTHDQQAAVFLHELGYTLGLRHEGNVDVNYKPNYLSVMNYAFEFNDCRPDRPLDYSHGLHIDVDEKSLNENHGIGTITDVTVWRGPDGQLYRSDGARASASARAATVMQRQRPDNILCSTTINIVPTGAR